MPQVSSLTIFQLRKKYLHQKQRLIESLESGSNETFETVSPNFKNGKNKIICKGNAA